MLRRLCAMDKTLMSSTRKIGIYLFMLISLVVPVLAKDAAPPFDDLIKLKKTLEKNVINFPSVDLHCDYDGNNGHKKQKPAILCRTDNKHVIMQVSIAVYNTGVVLEFSRREGLDSLEKTLASGAEDKLADQVFRIFNVDVFLTSCLGKGNEELEGVVRTVRCEIKNGLFRIDLLPKSGTVFF